MDGWSAGFSLRRPQSQRWLTNMIHKPHLPKLQPFHNINHPLERLSGSLIQTLKGTLCICASDDLGMRTGWKALLHATCLPLNSRRTKLATRAGKKRSIWQLKNQIFPSAVGAAQSGAKREAILVIFSVVVRNQINASICWVNGQLLANIVATSAWKVILTPCVLPPSGQKIYKQSTVAVIKGHRWQSFTNPGHKWFWLMRERLQ